MMLLDTLISKFIRQHYFTSIYEIIDRRGDSYAEIAIDTEQEYFYCSFCVLDEKLQLFTVFCENSDGKSFACRLDQNNALIDIKRDLFSAREILMHICKDLEALQEIDAFLSDPHNVDLFYEKLTFCRGKYGNEWFVALNPMFDDSRLDAVFQTATNVAMQWNGTDSRFTIYSGHGQLGQSVIDCNQGVVSVNNYILFMVLNPETRFDLVRCIPDKNSPDTIVYEGDIEIPNATGTARECIYCKFTVRNLSRLPATDIVMKLTDEEVRGETPLLILNHPESGLLHSTLRQQSMQEAIDEMVEIVNEYLPGKLAQTYIEHLNRVCQRWGVSIHSV